jgi:hypothetical protein
MTTPASLFWTTILIEIFFIVTIEHHCSEKKIAPKDFKWNKSKPGYYIFYASVIGTIISVFWWLWV